MLYPLENN